MKTMRSQEYVTPEAQEFTLNYEMNILSGNVENPDDPGTEIDI